MILLILSILQGRLNVFIHKNSEIKLFEIVIKKTN